ncbi:capsular biosynthesis protein, partial [Campylobacter jejuni]|nr:capsular biosynthesis protein [Campylobacter jejuni]
QDKIPTFIQNVILYEIFWQTQELVNHPEKLSFMDQVKIHKYLDLLDKIFYFINIQSIMKFNFNSFLFLYKMGFVYCFKKEKVPIDKVFIEQIDDKNDEILIKFYTADVNDEIKMLFDDRLAKIICSKIRQYDFLNRVFIYERRIWL